MWERVALFCEAGEYQRTARGRCVRRVYLILVNNLWGVTEKERNDICTIDMNRTFPMEKVGKIHGDVWSEVRNVHSRRVYQMLTHPELGEKEEHWFAFLPSSRPPDGDTEASQHRREKSLGPDQLPSTD